MVDKRFLKLRQVLSDEKKIISELEKLYDGLDDLSASEKTLVKSQINSIENKFKETHAKLKTSFTEILFSKPLEIEKKVIPGVKTPQIPKKETGIERGEDISSKGGKLFSMKEIAPNRLEKETVNRLREKQKKEKEKKKVDTGEYSKFASELFSKYSIKFLGQKSFQRMEDQLIKANLNYTPVGYMSTVILTTFISFVVAGFLFFFFLFFNFEAVVPFITRATEPINLRFFKVVWLLFAVPAGTFIFMYLYPAMEKTSAEQAIDEELPFATIHMAAISGSMINPVKIFEIIASTGEYPALEKEFIKMINEINLYGYDLVSALKNTAANSPSKKLGELLNGLSMTIHSGGDMVKFFDKRAQTFLFDYRIKQQKSSKSAETTMDIYISMVIAAPMILMLLMMIMKISGLGIAMSVGMISLLIILGVIVINVVFLTFMSLKKTK